MDAFRSFIVDWFLNGFFHRSVFNDTRVLLVILFWRVKLGNGARWVLLFVCLLRFSANMKKDMILCLRKVKIEKVIDLETIIVVFLSEKTNLKDQSNGNHWRLLVWSHVVYFRFWRVISNSAFVHNSDLNLLFQCWPWNWFNWNHVKLSSPTINQPINSSI